MELASGMSPATHLKDALCKSRFVAPITVTDQATLPSGQEFARCMAESGGLEVVHHTQHRHGARSGIGAHVEAMGFNARQV